MTNHYVATVPVKFTDNDGQERTRFQRVGAMFRNTRNGDGSEFFSLKLDFPVAVSELVMFPPSSREPRVHPLTRMGAQSAALSLFQGRRHRQGRSPPATALGAGRCVFRDDRRPEDQVATGPRPCGPRGKRTPRLPETGRDVSILLTSRYSIVR